MLSQREIVQQLYGTLRESFKATFFPLNGGYFKPRYVYFLRVRQQTFASNPRDTEPQKSH
jgi:hypothetical protein